MTEKARFCLRSTARIGQLLVALGIYSTAACAQTSPQETGIWLDDSGSGAVEIYVCADRADRLCGRIVWLKEPLNAQGVPKRDRYNPKESLQTRPICGLPVLGNLARVQEGGLDGGWIYDPKAGKSYTAAIQLARQDRLTVTGYVGIKFLSKSFTWTRAPADLQRCEGAAGPQAIKATKPAPAQPKPPASAAASPPKAPAASDAAMMAPAAPPAQKKPATATAAPPAKPAAAPAASPPKATAATATGSSAAKVSSTSTSSAGTPKAATGIKTGTKPVTGSAPPAKPATAAAQPNAAPPAPVAKKKPAPMEADNTSLVHGPFGWGE